MNLHGSFISVADCTQTLSIQVFIFLSLSLLMSVLLTVNGFGIGQP
jgi:hypothetical protein